jgi:isopenicillin-N epimerase
MNGGEDFWRSVRREFLLSADLVHLSGFWLASHPRRVRQAIEQHRRGLDENPYLYVVRNEEHFEEEMYLELEGLIGAARGEVAVTESTTTGLAMLLNGLPLPHDAEILTTTHEHYSMISALELISRRSGARVKYVTLYEDGDAASPEAMVERLCRGVTSATRLVALTLVHSCTGVLLPIKDMVTALRAKVGESVLIAVDATHAVGALPIDVARLGCDLLAGGCHKWLNGPRGTGFAWGRREVLERTVETVPSFAVGAIGRFTGRRSGEPVSHGQRLSPGGFHCFEHRWAIAEAIRFMSSIGISQVRDRLHQLCNDLKNGLAAIPRVRVITPTDPALSAGIVCFDIAGLEPEDVTTRLLRAGVVGSVSPYKRRYCRLTPFIFNLREEIERATAAVSAISATSTA